MTKKYVFIFMRKATTRCLDVLLVLVMMMLVIRFYPSQGNASKTTSQTGGNNYISVAERRQQLSENHVDSTKISIKFVSRGVRAALGMPPGASEPPVDNPFFAPSHFSNRKRIPKGPYGNPGGALWTRFASPEMSFLCKNSDKNASSYTF